MTRNKLVCVVGPTACGKTAMGVLLAKQYGGEVVSCDSMQLYRGMVIGTAAPTAEETEGVPHYMVGVIDPREPYSAARYAEDAGRCVDDILARGRLPIIVGGTGLYLDALLSGRGFAPGQMGGAVRAQLEARLNAEGAEALLAELRKIDPESATRVDPANRKRLIRALEVWYETGKTLTQHNAETRAIPPRYAAVKLGFSFENRDDMKTLIDRRVDEMAARGLFDEVRALLDAGVPRDATALQAIGYKECLACLDGVGKREDAIAEIKLRSRQYAKRQLTWLRRDPEIHWYYWKTPRNFRDALAFSTEILHEQGVS
ncbi:MAG: tRNA (adenosine(37)-N6)-dimethylallyltransferase MiaA [Ruminococcaceae bacterium]|jgi:tRNA dimethylallyltransferase|nr:tRNA (adenosine(37)-N6)-dimethylallyltransferase MiaA [Oscillospiraceae bacterium]